MGSGPGCNPHTGSQSLNNGLLGPAELPAFPRVGPTDLISCNLRVRRRETLFAIQFVAFSICAGMA